MGQAIGGILPLAGILDGWRTWLAGHNAAIMLVLFLVFGFLLVGQGIAGLS